MTKIAKNDKNSYYWKRRSSYHLKKSQIAGFCRFSRKIIFAKSKLDKVKLSNWHPPALLIGTSLHKSKDPFLHHFKKGFSSSFTRFVTILVMLQTIIKSREHADCELKRLLKIPAKIWHSFWYLVFFTLFLYIFFCNFEVKIARFIKLYE